MTAIDLRSDTVTQPTPAMREAMARAEVGDDVYGEDPTVARLERLAAERVDKEAALFLPSGTMANQVAIRALTRPGCVLAVGQHAHVQRYEGAAASALWGVEVRQLGVGGFFDRDELLATLPPDDIHLAPVAAVALENTHNVSGGRIWPEALTRSVTDAARERDLGLHLDGARIFNASVATGRPVDALCAPFDTVAFCLSKGLGAPVGSLACGSRARVAEMRRTRKLLGGGMRQAGILAAAGIHALEHHVEGLAADHENARELCDGLRALGLEVATPDTNMVVWEVAAADVSAPRLARQLLERGVRVGALDERRLRAVTHRDVSRGDIATALASMAPVLRP